MVGEYLVYDLTGAEQESCVRGCVFFTPSSDFISLCRCGQSNHTALGYAECVLVNANLAEPFVIKNFLW